MTSASTCSSSTSATETARLRRVTKLGVWCLAALLPAACGRSDDKRRPVRKVTGPASTAKSPAPAPAPALASSPTGPGFPPGPQQDVELGDDWAPFILQDAGPGPGDVAAKP